MEEKASVISKNTRQTRSFCTTPEKEGAFHRKLVELEETPEKRGEPIFS